MNSNRSFLLRVLFLGGMLVLVLVLMWLYRDTFRQEAARKQVETRWTQLRHLPIPAGAALVREELDGGAHFYGLDGRKTIVLDVTGMVKAAGAPSLEEQLRNGYAEHLAAWHPGLVNRGRSGTYTTVQGPPGLVFIGVELFDFEEAEAGTARGPAAAVALEYAKGGDGRGRRFAAVTMLLCLR